MNMTALPDAASYDRTEALSFLGALVEDIRTPLSWRVFDDTKRTGYARNLYGPFDQLVDALVGEQKNGCGVFVVVNVTKPHGTEDLDVIAPRALFIDQEGHAMPETWPLMPTLIVQRDDLHWHAYWMLAEDELIEQFRPAQERLIAFYGSDRRIKNESRVMRMPGFWHLKDPNHPQMYRVKHHAPKALYTIDQVLAAHPANPATAPKPSGLPVGLEVIDAGGRHDALLAMGGWLRRHGRTEAQILALLREFNREQCRPPKHDTELLALARDMAKHEPDQASTAMVEGLYERTIAKPTAPLTATGYVWRDPAGIPAREWVYGTHLIRGFLSLITAPGGAGKTALMVLDALAMAVGRNLAGQHVHGGPKRVWLWNLEDPREELERRVAATMQQYALTAEDIGDRLCIDSGRDIGLCVATAGRDGAVIRKPVIEALVEALKAKAIDVLMVDPFVSSHQVPENDNGGIDAVAKEWGRVAHRARCSIRLAHHVRKLGGQEATSESVRGGKALVDAARSVLVLNRMLPEEAERAGLDSHLRHFRAHDDKNNLAPAAEDARWFRFASVALANGDNVGVVVPWQWPDPFAETCAADLEAVCAKLGAGSYRESSQALDWAGNVVAEVLGVEIDERGVRQRIKTLLRTWIENKALRVVERKDETRRVRKFIVPGKAKA